MSKMGRNKGAAAERELAKLIGSFVGDDYTLMRNLVQTRDGGHDLDGIEGLSIECKRVEALSIATWWAQTLKQAGTNLVPILAYRQNRQPWSFLLEPAHVAQQAPQIFYESYTFTRLKHRDTYGTLAKLNPDQFSLWLQVYVRGLS